VWVPFTSESKEAIADYDEIRREVRRALQDCGRKLATYLRRRRRAQRESSRRGVFNRYIDEVVNALGAMTRVNRAALRKELLAISQRVTADADVALDEDGKPVQAAPMEESLGADTVVVDRESGEDRAPESLFADDTPPAKSKRKSRGRKKTPKRKKKTKTTKRRR
jgi:DNA topoisomerase-6 subunit B